MTLGLEFWVLFVVLHGASQSNRISELAGLSWQLKGMDQSFPGPLASTASSVLGEHQQPSHRIMGGGNEGMRHSWC